MMEWPDVLGILGAFLSIYCYARVQWQREFAKKMAYSFWNLVGTIFLLISLSFHWNVAAFVTNMMWGLVSLYGIYRCLKYRWREKKAALASNSVNNAQG